MFDEIRRFEELSFRTLPAIDQERVDGWVLRWSDGGARRANSVTVIDRSTEPVSARIDDCESWFARREAPPIFRITPLAEDELDGELSRRGFGRADPTDVMVATVEKPTAPAGARLDTVVSDDWLRTIAGNSKAGGARLARLREQLTGSGGESLFASVDVDGAPVAIGLGIVLDGITTIYNMNTLPEARRRGHAGIVLNTLLAAGYERGAVEAVLQVTQENVAAQRLYRGAGFSTVYEYWYRQRPPVGLPRSR